MDAGDENKIHSMKKRQLHVEKPITSSFLQRDIFCFCTSRPYWLILAHCRPFPPSFSSLILKLFMYSPVREMTMDFFSPVLPLIKSSRCYLRFPSAFTWVHRHSSLTTPAIQSTPCPTWRVITASYKTVLYILLIYYIILPVPARSPPPSSKPFAELTCLSFLHLLIPQFSLCMFLLPASF